MSEKRLSRLAEEIISCENCPRLVEFRKKVAKVKRRAYRDWDYWGRPVPGFGDCKGRLLIVGLAPAAHGANRTGRMFTGNGSGEWLYRALFLYGFANTPHSYSKDDGLTLRDVYISAILRCPPPKNRPTAEEIRNCLPYLRRELKLLERVEVFLALGQIAFNGITRILREWGILRGVKLKFGHNLLYPLEPDSDSSPKYLLTSYHPSQQNTLTGRLTEEMFHSVFARVKELLRIFD